MHRSDKEKVVEELAERLRSSQTLIVADYRGLTMPQVDALRSRLLEHGARFQVVKNTLTRRAAEAAGAEHLLALLDGPTAIAFLESDGDPVAVAKALGDAIRDTKILAVRGGVLDGKPITAEDVDSLGKLPPVDVLRGQVLGAVTAPLYAIVGLFTAPLQDLYGLIDARIEQLGGEEGEAAPAPEAEAAAEAEAPAPEPEASAEAASEPEAAGAAEPEGEATAVETPTTDEETTQEET
jgi:large subunit ribosomal protein L10